MTIMELWNTAAKWTQENGAMSLVVVIMLASVVEISPIKINPWKALSKFLRKYLGISEIREELENNQRTRILRFDDELISHVRHRKDMFDAIMVDCDTYERYCKEHSMYINCIAEDSIQHIREVYHKCKERGDFLSPETKGGNANED